MFTLFQGGRMHTTHVSSGGRYPVLRSLAILYLFAAAGVLVLGIIRAVTVLAQGGPVNDFFGAPTNVTGRILVALSWLAVTFIGVIGMLGVAELIKLFIDIEHNTRAAGMRMTSASAAAAPPEVDIIATPTGVTTVVANNGGPAAVGAAGSDGTPPGGRMGQWLEGEETAEGALFRGH
jgi:hypothetical protein